MWFWRWLWEWWDQAGWVEVEVVVWKIRVMGQSRLVRVVTMACCEKGMVSGYGHEKARRGMVPGGLGKQVVAGDDERITPERGMTGKWRSFQIRLSDESDPDRVEGVTWGETPATSCPPGC